MDNQDFLRNQSSNTQLNTSQKGIKNRNKNLIKNRRKSSSSSSITPNIEFAISPKLSYITISNNEFNITNKILDFKLDNNLPIDYFRQDILSILKFLKISKWEKINKNDYKLIKIDRISGAMTNCVYKLSFKKLHPLLLRIYGDVENIIDRNSELLTLIRLSKKNIGPKLLGCFKNGRFEEFLNNSITLNKLQIRDSKISRMIARRMKEFHFGVNLTYDEINLGPKSWILIEKWISIIEKKLILNSTTNNQKDLFILNWSQFKNLISIYKKWLYSFYGSNENLKNSLKFCHNDTQYGNLLFYNENIDKDDDDDDIDILSLNDQNISSSNSSSSPTPIIITDNNFKNDKKLTVIDFEYAGQNPPAYDITNHFCEWMYDYHNPIDNYKTDESKYPTVEERLNLLNSYVNYIPGSLTPHLLPKTNPSSSTPSSSSALERPNLNKSSSVISVKLSQLPLNVKMLFNETIYWRSTCSIFWALWAIISKGSIVDGDDNDGETSNFIKNSSFVNQKVEFGPNGEKYKFTIENDDDADLEADLEAADDDDDDNDDEEFFNPTLDDEFDHLKYALGKLGIFVGDMIQFGLLDKNSVDSNRLNFIKYLDTELLPI